MRMRFGKLVPLLLLLLVLPCSRACSASSIDLKPDERILSYSTDLPDQDFLLLTFSGPQQTGKMVIYAPDGHFEGEIALKHSDAGGKVKITLTSLDGKRQFVSGSAVLPAASDYQKASGKASGKVTDLQLEETVSGVRYAFSCPGSDYLLLKARSKQETAVFPVYPQENGRYSGEIEMPLTYARTMITVQVLSGKESVLAEAQARKGYEAPAAAERLEGRLSGVTVCIDPGHQENGHYR